MPRARLAQIAMSVSDLAVSGAWYEEVLGLVQAGGAKFAGDLVEQVTGVEGADLDARWLLDGQECFQYELFKVNNPPARPLAAQHCVADEGYAMIGVHVADFDHTLARASAFGATSLVDPVGQRGRRRAYLRDPDGIIVEIMEDDVRQDGQRSRPWASGSAFRFVTVLVPDPDETAAFLRDTFGATDAGADLVHGPEHHRFWLGGRMPAARVVWAGDIAIELVRFDASLGAARPAAYKLTDIGLLNVAFLFESRAGLINGFAEAQRLGATPNAPELADFGGFAVMYAATRQGMSVEMLHVDAPLMRQLGFEPGDSDISASKTIAINADAAEVWGRLAGNVPIVGTHVADSARIFTAGADGRAAVSGDVIEFRRRDLWWLEHVVAIEPGCRVLLCNRMTGGLTGLRLVDAAPSHTVLEITIRAVPGWSAGDEERLAQVTSHADELAADIARLFPVSAGSEPRH